MISDDTLREYAALAGNPLHGDLAEIAAELLAVREYSYPRTREAKLHNIANLARFIKSPDFDRDDESRLAVWYACVPVVIPYLHWNPRTKSFIFS